MLRVAELGAAIGNRPEWTPALEHAAGLALLDDEQMRARAAHIFAAKGDEALFVAHVPPTPGALGDVSDAELAALERAATHALPALAEKQRAELAEERRIQKSMKGNKSK